MDKEQIKAKVIETVNQVQDVSGRSSAGIGASTRPIGGVDGFDSLSGVEATAMLSASLGVDIPENYNPFISSDGKQALSVNEIANRLSTFIKAEAMAV